MNRALVGDEITVKPYSSLRERLCRVVSVFKESLLVCEIDTNKTFRIYEKLDEWRPVV